MNSRKRKNCGEMMEYDFPSDDQYKKRISDEENNNCMKDIIDDKDIPTLI
jgi:hypothetical protein